MEPLVVLTVQIACQPGVNIWSAKDAINDHLNGALRDDGIVRDWTYTAEGVQVVPAGNRYHPGDAFEASRAVVAGQKLLNPNQEV